ncbi:transposase zinc-binding domain-containing protein [Sorangium cellulosum]|nr:transposase zinc-binding domain-containing protein [Sorangium cellulosum]
MLFVFGLNGFLGFIPPPAVPERAAAFLDALTAMGYMVPLIKGVEVAAGALLLANRCVPLALVAFSCKGRGFCPSCLGRRMCATAAKLIEDVLPEVAHRRRADRRPL